VTIACVSATWAQELDLMQLELLRRLNEQLESASIEGLRFVVDGESC
jgi:predicted nucleic acid-binding Zn ribbon protein